MQIHRGFFRDAANHDGSFATYPYPLFLLKVKVNAVAPLLIIILDPARASC